MPFLGPNRATSRLSATGNSQHVRLPKPLFQQLGWAIGEELIVTITPDNAMIVQTIEAYFRQALEAERRQYEHERESVGA